MSQEPLTFLETRQPIWLAVADREQIVTGSLSEQGDTVVGLEYTVDIQDSEVEVARAISGSPDSSHPIPQSAVPTRALRVILDGRDHETAARELRPLLSRLRNSQIRLVTLAAPSRGGPTEPGSYPARYDFMSRVLRGIRFDAEASGARIAFEVGQPGDLVSPLEVRGLIDTVNSSAVGVTVNLSGVMDLGPACDWVDLLTRRLFAIRLSTGCGPTAAAENMVRGSDAEGLRHLVQSLNQIDNHAISLVCDPTYVELLAHMDRSPQR